MNSSTRKRKAPALPFAKVLVKVMQQKGLNAKQVSQMCNVPRSTISDWQSGVVPYDLHAIGRLAKSLNMTMRELLLGEREEFEFLNEKNTSPRLNAYDQIEVFDGLCLVTIKKIVEKKQ